jgi:hypothetical protein
MLVATNRKITYKENKALVMLLTAIGKFLMLLSLFVCLFTVSAGDPTQGLEQSRQVFYHQAASPALGLSSFQATKKV